MKITNRKIYYDVRLDNRSKKYKVNDLINLKPYNAIGVVYKVLGKHRYVVQVEGIAEIFCVTRDGE